MKDGEPPQRDKGSIRFQSEPSVRMKRPDNEIAPSHTSWGLYAFSMGERKERGGRCIGFELPAPARGLHEPGSDRPPGPSTPTAPRSLRPSHSPAARCALTDVGVSSSPRNRKSTGWEILLPFPQSLNRTL